MVASLILSAVLYVSCDVYPLFLLNSSIINDCLSSLLFICVSIVFDVSVILLYFFVSSFCSVSFGICVSIFSPISCNSFCFILCI